MGMIDFFKSLWPSQEQPVREAASAQGRDESGWRTLSGDGLASMNDRDLQPMAQERMQKLAEYLWQSNLIANRLTELRLTEYLRKNSEKLILQPRIMQNR